MKGVYIIWYREILIYLRNPIKFFTSLFLPFFILIFFNLGLKTISPSFYLTSHFPEFFFSGILGLSAATMAFSSTISTVWDREFGFLREILVSPVPRSHIVLGKILGAATTALIQGTLILLIAPFLGISLKISIFLKALLAIFLISYGMAGLGFFLASHLKRIESFSIVLQLIIAPMVFLSGAFFPINNSIPWMLKLSQYNPLTYGINILRWLLFENLLPKEEILKMTTRGLSYSLFAIIIFSVIITFISVQLFKKIK